MEKSNIHNERVLNLSESTPEERSQFYESLVISKEQVRQFAIKCFDAIMQDNKAMDEKDDKNTVNLH